RRGVCRRNSVRNRGESSRFNDYDFGISAIGCDTRNDQVLAVNKISSSTSFTMTTFTSKPSNSYALPGFPAANIFPERFDVTGNLVSGDSGIPYPRKDGLNRSNITVADACGFDTHPHLARSRLRHGTGHKIQLPWRSNFDGFVSILHDDLK